MILHRITVLTFFLAISFIPFLSNENPECRESLLIPSVRLNETYICLVLGAVWLGQCVMKTE